MNKHSNPIHQISILALTIGCSISNGQETTSKSDRQQTGLGLEEVVVTAQKREEGLQDVPISVAVVSGEELEKSIIAEFDDLQFSVPGVNFQKASDRRNSTTSIRGIGTSVFSPGIESSVAIVIDGVVAGREGAALFDFSDLKRVEILRGPQGTLFGKNASAGVVSLVSNSPTNELSGRASISYGEDNDRSINGAISGPIIKDKLLYRFNARKNERDGYIDNLNPSSASPKKLNDRNDEGAKAQLMFLADTWDITIAADWAESITNTGAFTQRSSSTIPGGVNNNNNTSNALAGITPSEDNRSSLADGLFLQDSNASGVAGTLNFSVGEHSFVWINSVREWDFSGSHDSDGSNIGGFAINTWDLEQDQISSEFRVTSPTGGKLDYVAGLFAFKQKTNSTGDIGLFDDSWFQTTAGFPLGTALFFNGLPLDSQVFTGSRQVTSFEEENLAVFGQASYEIANQTHLIIGGRFLSSDISATSAQFRLPIAGSALSAADIIPIDSPLLGDDKDTHFTWRVGIDHDLTEDILLFTSLSEGYKTGGFNLGFGVTADAATNKLRPIKPELPTQFEIGFRSQWFDKRLTVNGTAFYTIVDDFQGQAVRRVEASNGADTTFFDVVNAGETNIKGAEMEVTWSPAETTSIRLAAAYLDSKYEEFKGAPCYPTQALAANECESIDGQFQQDLSGESLPFAPKLITNMSALHNFDPVVKGKLTPWFSIDLQYRSETSSSINNSPFETIDAYTLANAQLGLRSDQGGWNIYLYGRNIFDKSFEENIFSTPFAENGGRGGDVGPQSQFISYRAQSQFGIKATMEF